MILGPNTRTATSWMADRLRTIPSERLGTHTRAAALALAVEAEDALHSPNGYSAIPARHLAAIIGLAPSTTRRHLDALVHAGLAAIAPGGYRVSEEAFA